MRGRSLLKETSCPSVCAFCAHRLGQARKPSHVQRRFLQSSRSLSKPPAEGAAVWEEEESKAPRPSWGRSGQMGAGAGSATWGRPAGGISSKPAASWGSPMAAGKGIPAAALGAGAIPARPGAFGSSIPAGNQAPVGAAGFEQTKPKGHDLLPHERAARDRMLAEYTKTQARPVQKPVGPGPEMTRAGRPEPRTRYEMIDSARRQMSRRKEFDSPEAVERRYRDGMSGPRITRHVAGDRDWGSHSNNSDSRDYDISRWSQLRREGVVDEPQPPRVSKFVESRAEREEQAKTAGYRPLSTRSFKPTFDRYAGRSSDSPRQERSSWAQGLGERMVDLSRSIPARPTSNLSQSSNGYSTEKHRESIMAQQAARDDTPTKEGVFRSETGTEAKAAVRSAWEDKEKPGREEEEEEEEREERRGRRKEKKRRGASEQRSFLDEMPKGKDRDKAKRRQQFARTNDEVDADADASAARAEAKRLKKLERAAEKAAAPTPILLPEYISVSNLAVALKIRLEDFVNKMEELGFEERGHDHILNAENAGLIAQEYNFEPIIERGESEDLKAREPAPDPSILPPRPPVVTIMGHVDHGKTTLLDYLRKSSVAAGEHGGITQHIGAFSVPMPSGKIITFLDTPGHAAFLSMRQRGANVTDIVILVVAADDSVKPQTIEAINHAKAAKVPVIVAINKIDKPDTNIDRVKQDLARHGVDIEDYGGDVQAICVSGKTGQGMPELEEAAVTLSEILDMRAETDGPAEGWVIEASIKSMGKVATVLVRRGTMRPGDFIVAGNTWARIRCLRNEAGMEIEEAGPGTPVQIDGWREQPLAGDEVLQAPDEAKAKSVIDFRLEKVERDKMAQDMEAINESRKAIDEKREREKAEKLAEEEAKAADEVLPEKQKSVKAVAVKEIFFVIKGDVSGSVEAVIDQISGLGTKEVVPHILHSGVGQVSEFDIEHAAAAKGFVINFNTDIQPNIARLAHDAKVTIMDHNIIYRLVDDVKAELSKHLPPLITQRVLGEAEISQVFSITVKGRQQKSVAGCKVRNGTISKTAKVRVLRAGEKVFDGTLASLKNVKKDVQEMKKGSECGMGFEDWFDFHVGDQVQSYEEKHERRYL